MGDDRFRLEDFELYQLARAFRNNVYRVVASLPPEEKFALDPQI